MDYARRREEFLSKVLSRKSSVGGSSHVCYYRNAAGVPFKWEMQPGTPKHPPPKEELPPLSPPPAILSLRLPKPVLGDQPKPPNYMQKLQFWKKRKSSRRNHNHEDQKIQQGFKECRLHGVNEFDELARLQFCSSDCEFIASPRNSTSSGSSSFSFAYAPSLRVESPQRDVDRKAINCSPWKVNSILVSIARRI